MTTPTTGFKNIYICDACGARSETAQSPCACTPKELNDATKPKTMTTFTSQDILYANAQMREFTAAELIIRAELLDFQCNPAPRFEFSVTAINGKASRTFTDNHLAGLVAKCRAHFQPGEAA